MIRRAGYAALLAAALVPGVAMAQDRGPGAAGTSLMIVLLVAAGAAILAVLLAYLVVGLPLRRRIDTVQDRQVRMGKDIGRLLEQVAALELARTAPPPPPPPSPSSWGRAAPDASPPARSRYALLDDELPPPAPRPAARPETPPIPVERPSDRTAIVRDRLARYRELVAGRARPRQMQDLIDEDSGHRGVHYDPAGRGLSLVPFDADDPSQMLVAIAGPAEGMYFVLPTSNYVENFRMAFSAPVQNTELVRHLFDFERDDSGNLQLIEPARIRIDDSGNGHKDRAGRMGGYSSS